MSATCRRLSRLNERYRAPTIIVASSRATRQSGPLTVGGLRYDTQTGARSEIPKVPVQDAGQLAEAAKKMHAKLDEQWRGVAVVRRDAQDTLDVFVPIRALGDWVQVRQRLGGVPAIKSVVRAHPRVGSCRAASGIFRHPRGAAAHPGAGRPDARQGCRQVAIAGAVIARAGG